ncbi:MAG: SprT family zinc-dependent metalloprotease, partial [Balneolaceae bacterium]|nr:SprT family zinc-dependent metalloprotease [Balneolaceae bacterium]
QKHIKNMYLRVYQGTGKIVVTAPAGMKIDRVEAFVRSKEDWIGQRLSQTKTSLITLDTLGVAEGDLVPVWGVQKKILYRRNNHNRTISDDESLQLNLKSQDGIGEARSLLLKYYRSEMRKKIPDLISTHENRMDVEVAEYGIRKMKTRWGSCNIRARRIWLNLELALYPPEILEYVLIHEMVHLHERLHNKRFYRLMDRFLPDWKNREKQLKRGLSSC